jgi:hypothetical protein
MAETLIIQDWITLSGDANQTVVQSECDYVDIGDYRDVFIYLDVKAASGSPTVLGYVSPTVDDALFYLNSLASATTGLNAFAQFGWTLTGLTARYFRWSVTASVAWSTTFRLIGVGWKCRNVIQQSVLAAALAPSCQSGTRDV